MAPLASHADEQLRLLQLPLLNIGRQSLLSNRQFADATRDVLHAQRTESTEQGDPGGVVVHTLRMGEISLVCGKTTPMVALMGETPEISILLAYQGRIEHRHGRSSCEARDGALMAMPNDGGTLRMGVLSAVAFNVGRQHLMNTIRALCGSASLFSLDEPLAVATQEQHQTSIYAKVLFNLLEQVDLMLLEDPALPVALGLDDQVHRLIAMAYITHHDLLKKVEVKERSRLTRQSEFDDLVDYIRSHALTNIGLRDLKAQSHYSARHLQQQFRDRFDCTPMQFVRRQRLSIAMEKLQTGATNDTVAGIARECGYRHTSHFTSDFQREFDTKPSIILRASRSARRGQGVGG